MNSLKSQQLLNSIDTTLTTSNTTLTNIDTNASNLNTISAGISMTNTKLDTANTELSSIDSKLTPIDTINNNISTIKTDVSTLAKKKIIFNALLTDGSNLHLTRTDYSSSPIHFSWQNDKGTPVYIYKYRFAYPPVGGTEPGPGQLYHNTSWTCNIGAMNSAETGYEAPYIEVKTNKFYFHNTDQNHIKQNWVSTSHYNYQHDFSEAPIEIGISRKFGHYINANISTSTYDAPPIGIVDGYYFAS